MLPRTGRILEAVQYARSESIEKLGKSLRIKPNQIRYDLEQLEESKVIRPSVVVDLFRLGVSQYQFYISLGFHDGSLRKKVLRGFRESEKIAWCGELAGRYQLGCSVCATSPKEAQDHLEELMDPIAVILDRSVGFVDKIELYSKSYLSATKNSRDKISLSSTVPQYPIDEGEEEVLLAVLNNPGDSISTLASTIGIPRTTFSGRVKRLEENGVLKAWSYLISANELGRNTYRLLVKVKRSNDKLRDKVQKYAQCEEQIVTLLEVIGEWDFELTAEVPTPRILSQLVEGLAKTIGSDLLTVEILQVIEQFQADNFRWGI